MVVTGGAAAGKSTVCRVWEQDPRVFALDLDAVGNDPFIRRPGNNDYVGLWGFNLRLALEMQLNGLAPLLCGFCYPDQIFANPEVWQFGAVHVLALVCDENELSERLRRRPGGEAALAVPDIHRELDLALRSATVPAPGTLTVLDTSDSSVESTIAFASNWIEEALLPT